MHSIARRVAFAGAFLAAAVGAQDIPPTYGQPATPKIVGYVQMALRNRDLPSAEALAAQYRKLNGDTPEALEALAWAARGELAFGQPGKAFQSAEEIVRGTQAALATRPLDAEPQLPLALGSAYEVEAESLYTRGRRAEALKLLQAALLKWRGTSLVDRLRKNINLMTLQGQPMPPLHETEWIGAKPEPVSSWRGKVVLLFFWAHWCADCKADSPVIAKLARELEPRGLIVVAPTQRYGYTADDEHAPPAKETAFINKVFERYYAAIPKVRVPLSAANFERFGASTTPTIVLIDRRGIVRLYHPGLMDEASLRAAIEPLLAAR